MVHESAEGPLDAPASRDHLEALVGRAPADDFDAGAQSGTVGGDGLGAVAGGGPGLVMRGSLRRHPYAVLSLATTRFRAGEP